MGFMKRLASATLLVFLFAAPAGAEKPWPQKNGIPVPKSEGAVEKTTRALFKAKTPEEIMGVFLGVPYRADGCIDETGRYTLFAAPDTIFETPGLNCSGFVLEASRLLLKKNFTLAEATRDRRADSGPDADLGEDWDFGWDLIMNISEGSTRIMLLPGNKTLDPAKATGLEPLGFDLHDAATWAELPGRIKEGRLYLISFNKPSDKPGYTLQHYHVGLFFRASAKDWYMYNTTGQSKRAYRRNLGKPEEQSAFLRAFANTGKARKKMCIIEVVLPE